MKIKTKHFIVSGIIVLLAGVSVYVVWLQTHQAPTVLGETATSITWQQATNNQYGFSYQYPNNLYVDQQTNAVTWLYDPSPFDFISGPKTTDGSAKSGIQVQVYENPTSLTLSDWMKKQTKFPAFTTKEVTLQSGTKAFTAETPSEDWKARKTYFIELDEAILQLSFYANSDALAEKDLPNFQTLVDSLKLTAQAQAVSTETYQNGTVGFLFDYPSNLKISDEKYDEGKIALKDDAKKLTVEMSFGGKPSEFKDLVEYAKKQDEAKEISKPATTKVSTFTALVSILSADTNNSYYYLQTSVGYFTIKVKRAKDISLDLNATASNIINSFRVYELVSTKGWQNYVSSDGAVRLQYPADASIENLSNGVQVQEGDVKVSLYSYKNLGLSILDWVDSAQLNKYKGADSHHFAFKVISEVDGKDALRTIDPVSNLKLATYITTKDTMYIAELSPFDAKDLKNLAVYNTILSTLKLK